MKKHKNLDGFSLKMIAIISMAIDHVGYVLYPDVLAFRMVGRLAFPIFAFLAAQGMAVTKNPKRYCIRTLIFAVLSEIPYDLMVTGQLDATRQNVLWTFFIALVMMYWMRVSKGEDSKSYMAAVVGGILFGGLIAFYIQPDYGMWGVELALVFYMCIGWDKAWIAQLIAMAAFNLLLLSGKEITVWGLTFSIQCFGILALLPIWLYNGKQGPYNKWIKYGFYLFYPLHMLILYVVGRV